MAALLTTDQILADFLKLSGNHVRAAIEIKACRECHRAVPT